MTVDKLESLKIKQRQLAARIETLQAADIAKQRKQDTRRKILVGAYTLDQAKQAGELDALYGAMGEYLTRAVDKQLFQSLIDNGKNG